MRIAPRASVEVRRKKVVAPAVETEKVTVHPDPHGIYRKLLPLRDSASGPEYPGSPESPDPRLDTPAPPHSEQIWHI